MPVIPDSFYRATLVSNMDYLRFVALRQTLWALRPIALQVWQIVFGEPPEIDADSQLLPIELLPPPPPPPAAGGLPARRRRGRAPPWIRIARGIFRLDFTRRVWGLLGQHLRSSKQRGREIVLRV